MPDVPARLASLYLDGDRLALAVTEESSDGLRVLHADHRRLPHPFERIRRLRHPVYLDSDLAIYTSEAFLQEELKRILEPVPADIPVLTVLAPDKERREALEGSCGEEEQTSRRRQLLRRLLPASPYDYPCLVVMQEQDREAQVCCTRVISVRMAELLPMQRLVINTGRRHWGTIPGLTAASVLASRLCAAMGLTRLSLMDCGALRTLFISTVDITTTRNNVIPVGYLSTRHAGDRFAREPEEEIPHFAARFLSDMITVRGELDGSEGLCLLGSSGSITSLEERVAGAIGRTPAVVSEEAVSRLVKDWPAEIPFAAVSMAVGGLLAAGDGVPRQFGPLHGKMVSPPLSEGKCALWRMKDRRMYVFEQRYPL